MKMFKWLLLLLPCMALAQNATGPYGVFGGPIPSSQLAALPAGQSGTHAFTTDQGEMVWNGSTWIVWGGGNGTINPSQINSGNLPPGVNSSAGNALVDTAAVQNVAGKTFLGPVGLQSTGTPPDPVPQYQNGFIGNSLSQFAGQYHSDPTAFVGYDWQPSILCKNHADPACGAYVTENNYTTTTNLFATVTGTAGASTTSSVLHGTGFTNARYSGYILYDETLDPGAPGSPNYTSSCVIASNTTTTVTCTAPIAGMTVGDTYEILEEDTEAYFEEDFWNGSSFSTSRPFMWTWNKSESIHTGSLVSSTSQYYCFGGNGCQFKDTSGNTLFQAVPGTLYMGPTANTLEMQSNASHTSSFLQMDAYNSGAAGESFRIQAYGTGWSIFSSAAGVNEQQVINIDNNPAGHANVSIGDTSTSNSSVTINPGGPVILSGNALRAPNIGSDATHTDSSVCQDTTSHAFYSGSGTAGICLGTSSALFKNRIKPLDVGLGEIMDLKPVKFHLNADHGDPFKEYYGFTAQDMRPVLPELVGADTQGQPNTADYLGVVPVLVKAIQEQQHEIESLKRQLRSRLH